MGLNLFFGEFKTLETEYMRECLFTIEDKRAFTKLNEAKEKMIKCEVMKLKTSLGALERTITTIKEDVKSRTSGQVYEVWLKRINRISERFKSLYSEINNDQFNHLYKMSKKARNAWDNVSLDLEWLKTNVCDYYSDDNKKAVKTDESVNGDDFKKLFEEKPLESGSFTTKSIPELLPNP